MPTSTTTEEKEYQDMKDTQKEETTSTLKRKGSIAKSKNSTEESKQKDDEKTGDSSN